MRKRGPHAAFRNHRIALASLAALGTALPAAAQDALPSLGTDGEPWQVDVYYENDTRVRGEDNTGHAAGLSKFRNTLQVEADKKLGDGWAFHGILRGTWDGVYRLNKDEYGKSAGGSIELANTAGVVLSGLIPPGAPGNFGNLRNPTVPFGGGFDNAVATAFGLPPGNAFGFNSSDPNAPGYNPNEGLRVLGDRWHDTGSGVALAVPVRPCDYDRRGCRDFGGYGDKDLSELEFPEFNERLDFIREAFVRKTFELPDSKALFLKLGRQQVVWGRTDLFRVLDVINPVDYSRNNIYDELQDIRIPMWILQAEYRMGPSQSMQDRNLQVVWNFDKFRPHNLGQCGTPNVILDGACFFRAAANLWDNGGTVGNFAPIPPGTPGAWAATDFGPHQVGIRNVHLPEWSLKNTQLGIKYEGVTAGGLSFSVNALTYRSQLPSLRAFNSKVVNPFTGGSGNTTPPAAGVPLSHLIAFDMYFPRVNLVGGSMDFQIEAAKAAVRIEAALTHGEEFPNTLKPRLYSKNKVFRSVIGIDRPTFLPLVSDTRAALVSAQLFYQHIFDHELEYRAIGPVGMPDWKDNFIATLLIRQPLLNDRLNPQLILARDFRAHAWAAAPSVDWSVTNDLTLTVGANIKGSGGDKRWAFDDCRSCNPYPPFTTYTAVGQGFVPGSVGLGGIEPLGRFRAGPIGAAWKEDEIFMTLKYRF
jgi:hypothetical protein